MLDTASTKQFFNKDEIKLSGSDQKNSVKRIKDEAVPLQYIRDHSKLSDKNLK